MANIQQTPIIFLARLIVQIDFDLIGWQIAMYRSMVNAVKDSADASIPKY